MADAGVPDAKERAKERAARWQELARQLDLHYDEEHNRQKEPVAGCVWCR